MNGRRTVGTKAREENPGRLAGRRMRRQLVLLALGGSLLTGAVLVGLVGWASTGLAVRGADQTLTEVTASTQQALTRGPGGAFAIRGAPLDLGTVVYDDDGRPLAGRPIPPLADAYRDLATSTQVTNREIEDTYRVRSTPVAIPEGTTVHIVTAVSVRGYESAERFAFLLSLAAACVLVVGTTTAAALVSRQTWRRVERIAHTAETWSEHDLDRRFDVGDDDHELSVLAGTLNTLLDQVSRALGAERRLTAEMAHELRSPLAAVQGLTDLLLARDDLDDAARADVAQIGASCDLMGRTIATLLDVARAPAGQGEEAVTAAGAVDALLEGLPEGASVTTPDRAGLQLIGLAVPADLAARAVAPVLANAVRHGQRVRIVVEQTGTSRRGMVVIHVDDDGPGVPDSERDHIFQPGVTGGGGAGLGLPLARRLARGAGGDVVCVRAPDGWSRFTVSLPSAVVRSQAEARAST